MNARRVTAAAAVLTVCACALTACASSGTAAGVELVIGSHANQPFMQVPQAVVDAIDAAVLGDAPVGVVMADGAPYAAHTATAFRVIRTNAESTAAGEDAAYATIRAAVTAAPRTAGADLLTALVMAADDAHSTDGRTREISVVDNGIGDSAGVLDLTDPQLLRTPTSSLVQQLLASHEIERDSFSGLTVHFAGLATTAAPQPALSATQRHRVEALWRSIVTAGGGRADIQTASVPEWPLALQRRHARTLPVGVVTREATRLTLVPGEEQSFGESSALAFVPGTPTFLHSAEAKVLLATIATQLRSDPTAHLRIEGRTSGEGDFTQAQNVTLSRKRAAAVETLLTEAGVGSDRITAVGVGYVAKPDENAGGRFSELRAARNRVVVLTLTR